MDACIPLILITCLVLITIGTIVFMRIDRSKKERSIIECIKELTEIEISRKLLRQEMYNDLYLLERIYPEKIDLIREIIDQYRNPW